MASNVPTSKTAMLDAISRLDRKAVIAGFEANSDLVAYRDEKGRNWLHIICATDRQKRKQKSTVVIDLAGDLLIDHGFDTNEPAFTEGTWHARAHGTRLHSGTQSHEVKTLRLRATCSNQDRRQNIVSGPQPFAKIRHRFDS